MAKRKTYPMLTSNPKHKRDQRLGPYGERRCPLCYEKLKLAADLSCKWKE
jgi:hypothetical protein